jgi:hypothetical protein
VQSFSRVDWTKSSEKPAELKEAEQDPQAEQGEQEVAVDSLEPEVQAAIDETPEAFEGMSAEEMGNYETIDDGDAGATVSSGNDREENEEAEFRQPIAAGVGRQRGARRPRPRRHRAVRRRRRRDHDGSRGV